jgi:LAO/AO transport system kinase
MVDLFLLLLLPSGGDELQGIKKGVVEIADLVVVNKADGEMKAAAARAAAEYQSALRMLKPLSDAWQVPVLRCSSLTGAGVPEVWDAVGRYRAAVGDEGLAARRAEQARAWLWSEIDDTLLARFRRHPDVATALPEAERAVMAGETTPGMAAESLLTAFGVAAER